MLSSMENKLSVPVQETGSSSDTTSSFKASTSEEAIHFFKKVRERLLDVNHWKETAVIPSAEFNVCDQFGRKVNRTLHEGDHFRISIPGPGNSEGDGDDWVKVEQIEENYSKEKDHIIITVRPCANPVHPHETAHFFTNEATSSFIVERNDTIISASVHGRNEKPNTDVDSVSGKIRNAMVATAAIGLFSKMQWKSLVDGLVRMDE